VISRLLRQLQREMLNGVLALVAALAAGDGGENDDSED
jgi:hypothetical protein